MMKISIHGNDTGSLLPSVVITSFMILCVLLALSAWTNRYAEYARKKETAFRAEIGLQNGEEVKANEND